MVLEVVKYGHPTLRQRGERISAITPEVRAFVEDMLETMYAAHGIGLAAQQVARAWQVTVIDLREVTDRPSTLRVGGQPANVADHMPLVLINPEVTPTGEAVTGPEGCLSFPEIYADITRPGTVHVKALSLKGETFEFDCGGLLAKAVQHEVDHLQGILFIDRMTKKDRDALRPDIEDLQAETKAALARTGRK
jgi:peptide deformylase